MVFGRSLYVRTEPPDYLAQRLIETEEVIFATRLHSIRILPRVLLWLGSVLLAVLVTFLVPDSAIMVSAPLWILVSPAAFCYMFVRLWSWTSEWYIATNARMIHVRVFLFTDDKLQPMSQVTDLTHKVEFWGEVFGYGTFIFETAGQNQAFDKLPYVPQSHRLYRELMRAKFGNSDGEVYRASPVYTSRFHQLLTELGSFLPWLDRAPEPEPEANDNATEETPQETATATHDTLRPTTEIPTVNQQLLDDAAEGAQPTRHTRATSRRPRLDDDFDTRHAHPHTPPPAEPAYDTSDFEDHHYDDLSPEEIMDLLYAEGKGDVIDGDNSRFESTAYEDLYTQPQGIIDAEIVTDDDTDPTYLVTDSSVDTFRDGQ